MRTILLILLVDAGLISSAASFGAAGRNALAMSVLAGLGCLIVWQLALFAAIPFASRDLHVENGIRTPHYVQAIVQCCLYAYWGLYWDGVGRQAPPILVQLVFAYALEMLLSWTRHRVWRFGFGPFPVVLSINLFLWFRDDWFYLQLALIAGVYLGKEFVTWKRDGRRRHIFNPSAFALAVTAVVLMATSSVKLTTGADLIVSFILPPHFFEVVLLLGLVVQVLFGTAPVTLGAAIALIAAHHASRLYYGGPASFFPIDPSVFIGITLLVTDPATTPKTLPGKWMFGLCYGAGIFFTFLVLRHLHQPGYFDKILAIPAVNLLVPWFDRRGKRIAALRSLGRLRSLPARAGSFASIAMLCGLVALQLPPISPKKLREFSDPLPPDPNVASRAMRIRFFNRLLCQMNYLPEVYAPFSFRAEFRNLHRVKEILDDRRLYNSETLKVQRLHRESAKRPAIVTVLPCGTRSAVRVTVAGLQSR
jgi:hypothetical protein